MSLERAVEELIAREVETLGYELVKIESSFPGRRGILRIFIDRPDAPVTIDDCVRVTKSIALALDGVDAIPGPYNLEVSSPGSYRPLAKSAHYARFRGERARIAHLDDSGARLTVIGVSADADDAAVTIRAEDGVRAVPYERIIRANLQPDDGARPEARSARRVRRPKRRG